MNIHRKAYLTYALDKAGSIVHIDEVPNGNECGCICPDCKSELVAKNGGTERKHHFAHKNGKECETARMTALHMLAQQIIKEHKTVMLPNYSGKYYKKSLNAITFDEVVLEDRIKTQDSYIKPDCIGIKHGKDNTEHKLWIEILVSHKVDSEKQRAIRELKASCIEIDLSDLLKTDYSEKNIQQRLFENRTDRKWISCPKYDELDEEEQKTELARLHQGSEMVKRWFQYGDFETAEKLTNILSSINITKNTEEFLSYPSVNNEEAKSLFYRLVPDSDFLSYIRRAPKNEHGLTLFYTLLRYSYEIFELIPTTDINDISDKLEFFSNKKNEITAEEKIELEQLISLQVIITLKTNDKHRKIDQCFFIETFFENKKIRNEVLMVASIIYHHIVGSNAKTFGKLIEEIMLEHPPISWVFFSIANSKGRHYNDYNIDDRNMLDELKAFSEGKSAYKDGTVFDIISTCYNFKDEPTKKKHIDNSFARKTNSNQENNNKALKELNEMMKNIPSRRK